jgi:uncharacterized Zn-finger protein
MTNKGRVSNMAQDNALTKKTEQNVTQGSSKTLPPEIITVPRGTDSVSCDGGHTILGHPKVWYTFDGDQPYIECRYCDRRFVRE